MGGDVHGMSKGGEPLALSPFLNDFTLNGVPCMRHVHHLLLHPGEGYINGGQLLGGLVLGCGPEGVLMLVDGGVALTDHLVEVESSKEGGDWVCCREAGGVRGIHLTIDLA